MGFGCAKEDTGATLALFSEVIRSPALSQPKVDLYKAQARRLGCWTQSTMLLTVHMWLFDPCMSVRNCFNTKPSACSMMGSDF